MIAIQSKIFFEESVIKSLEILAKEKEINHNYFAFSDHQNSIENCIIDIFNTFLGQNDDSIELYDVILPSFMEKTFKLEKLRDLKSLIKLSNLFVCMQFHNRVYFHVNLNINFCHSKPLVIHDIKAISPYYVNKWYKKSYESTFMKINPGNEGK